MNQKHETSHQLANNDLDDAIKRIKTVSDDLQEAIDESQKALLSSYEEICAQLLESKRAFAQAYSDVDTCIANEKEATIASKMRVNTIVDEAKRTEEAATKRAEKAEKQLSSLQEVAVAVIPQTTTRGASESPTTEPSVKEDGGPQPEDVLKNRPFPAVVDLGITTASSTKPRFWTRVAAAISIFLFAVLTGIGIFMAVGEKRGEAALFYTICGAALAVPSIWVLVNQARTREHVADNPTGFKEYAVLVVSSGGIILSLFGLCLAWPEAIDTLRTLGS